MGKIVCSYFFGFNFQTEPIAYAHLLAVRNNYLRHGLARQLYEHFVESSRKKGFMKMKAITKPTNKDSVGFHKSIWMKLIGNEIIDGINVVRDYSGPGEHRVVFIKKIENTFDEFNLN